MVTLPGAVWREWHGLAMLVDALGGAETTRLVGGAVRDGLLGLPVSDIDMATRLVPEDVVRRLGAARIKAVPTGLAHGTVTAVVEGRPVEVTTLRRDVATDGRHAVVAFSDDWREDAARRDFTINALYADVRTGEVFDWFGGMADLTARRVRFIGDPLIRIKEDHLRVLRFFRFHARFGVGEPDADGLDACVARANDLMALSRERIASELLKLLDTADPSEVVQTMIERGVLRPVLPEIVDAAPLRRLVGREAELGVEGDAVRRLAALIGPHPALARSIGARLKLSNAHSKRLAVMAARDRNRADVLAYRHGTDGARDLLLLSDGDAAEMALLSNWTRPVMPMTGGQLIARGVAQGPQVAKTLARVEAAWIQQGFPTGDAFDTIVTEALTATS